MERERQEPTLGKADLSEVNFRPRHKHGPQSSGNHGPPDESKFWIRAVVLLAAAVLIAMGLIEWNARRQVAALERALTLTPEQQAALDAEIKRSEREDAELLNQVRRRITVAPRDWQPAKEPLRAGQRCIQGRRLERIEGGWRDIPNSPC
ncbi:hypothetical protein [Stenotrophomonas sp. SY1]|uniref:hypothetical protein n=1 Tax=Stenotrophomonas sp. SY1 TaxID=477235 RepID=UPI001E529F23|nr:hypothetical protein [Stenotrophomonas sp. SY1]MCD9087071.1 hypothetical protein [Stenotrophomonas sp. SY1]